MVKICQFVRLMAKFFDVSRLKVNPIKTLLVSKVHLVTEMDNLTKFRQTVWMFMDFGKFLVKYVEAKSAWGIWRFWRIFAIFVMHFWKYLIKTLSYLYDISEVLYQKPSVIANWRNNTLITP